MAKFIGLPVYNLNREGEHIVYIHHVNINSISDFHEGDFHGQRCLRVCIDKTEPRYLPCTMTAEQFLDAVNSVINN